ncbi:MAG: aminoglycoside phosphotransferase family protein [Propionibacteriaceae bacterium]|nr:aminoglycoside phosphotransferase family protein [Propionibacteriaceae bacterium]
MAPAHLVAEDLARALADGVRTAGQHWRVTRAWPADLADPTAGYVLELVGEDGRVRGAALADGCVDLRADEALPALAPLVEEGWTVLGHRLGKRAVLRRDNTGPYRKLATPKATKRASARADAIARRLADAPEIPGPPVRVGLEIQRGYLDLAPAAGRSLRAVLADPATRLTDAELLGWRLGMMLARLARIRRASDPAAEELPSHGLADEADVVERWVTAACLATPLSAPAATRLRADADEVIAALRATREVPGVLCHRDLHDGQVLVAAEQGLTVLDWDTAAWADPCLDAGNLLAHLDLLAEQQPAAAARSAAAIDGVLAVLLAGHHPAASDPARLALWRTASRVRITAVHAFRR